MAVGGNYLPELLQRHPVIFSLASGRESFPRLRRTRRETLAQRDDIVTCFRYVHQGRVDHIYAHI